MNLKEIENEVQEYWDKENTFAKLVKKNQDKPKWTLLDRPITANNPMGVHHAWGRTYKDVFQRYHAMTGHSLNYRNGFDCQGLWVEVEVEKELGLKSKKDIETFGVEKFIDVCKMRVDRYAKQQTQQSVRLGYWMDWDKEEDWERSPDARRSYYTHSDVNNYAIWSFLKKCHEENLIYCGEDVMPWCPRCETGLSQMEMHEGYKTVTHQSAYILLTLEKPDYWNQVDHECLLVWTTTPWTVPYNQAAAINPKLTYLKLKSSRPSTWIDVDKKHERPVIFYASKEANKSFKCEVIGEVSGEEMLKWRYHHPFQVTNVCPILPWEEVLEDEGTGIVHLAPSCGRDDFILCKKHGVQPGIALTEDGKLLDCVFAGSTWTKANKEVLKHLRTFNRLFRQESYSHSYPHCWRCGTELVYRLVDEWFINMKWRDRITKSAEEVEWLPEFGKQRELDWLENMGDWMISKKRYWGLALPIWSCKCGWFDVIGSEKELRERALNDIPSDKSPHKPWLDKVEIECGLCGKRAYRIPDVGNPWLDAGIVPFSTMSKDRLPADFICESFPGQFRNWFYALLAMGTMMNGKSPFKKVLGYATVKDDKGMDMHKSKGNSIPFDEAADKMGVDVMRWLYARQNPANDLLFGYKAGDEIRNKVIGKLYNCFLFYKSYVGTTKFSPDATMKYHDIDLWLQSETNLFVRDAKECYETCNLSKLCSLADQFINDHLSNWYIRRNRRRFSKKIDVSAAFYTLQESLLAICRVLAPIIPFITEHIHLAMTGESVHLQDFPVPGWLISKERSDEMKVVIDIVSRGLKIRNDNKVKVRQPLAEFVIIGEGSVISAVNRYRDHIKEELNVKDILLTTGFKPANKTYVGGNNLYLDVGITEELKQEGTARELVRQIQDYRKQLGLVMTDQVKLILGTLPQQIHDVVSKHRLYIESETASKLSEWNAAEWTLAKSKQSPGNIFVENLKIAIVKG